MMIRFSPCLFALSPAECEALQPKTYAKGLGYFFSSPVPQEEPQADGLGFALSLPSSPAPQEAPGLGSSLSLPSSFAPQEEPQDPFAAIAVNPALIKLCALFPVKNLLIPPFHAPNKFNLLIMSPLKNLFYKKGFVRS
jgi:hypothetical protein